MEDQKELSVILVHKELKLEVNRHQLICKSQYFALLLSTSYIDHREQEHNINYDVPISTLQDYVSWIHDDEFSDTDNDPLLKPSLTKFLSDSSPESLLKMLHLSVLFITDELKRDIIYIIESIWLIPEYLINIGCIAIDLGILELKDLAFAASLKCLDRLPAHILRDADNKNFVNLLVDKHLRYSDSDIYDTTNNEPTISGIVTYDLKSCKSELSLYCWDNTKFFEHSKFRYPKEIIKNPQVLIGMQFTGNGHNVYLCGGEYGLGSGKFNKKIWRYSLISKNWFVEALMPNERRHMIAVFFNNKLYLVGGVGKFRVKQASIDIYDTYQKTWEKGADLPAELQFTNPINYCVIKDSLIITQTDKISTYDFYNNIWSDLEYSFSSLNTSEEKLLLEQNEKCYIEINDTGDEKEPYEIFLTYVATNDAKCNETICSKEMIPDKSSLFSGDLKSSKYFVFPIKLRKMYVYTIYCIARLYVSLSIRNFLNMYDNPYIVHLHTIPIPKSIKFASLLPPHGSRIKKFFNIMDPANLYNV